ncbi:MAG TPA: DUF5655 domain-containing protein [Acidimicrobiia bacterium]|nr:DUF5655 domain-containing protein [Acidimicrobiia bacterium]
MSTPEEFFSGNPLGAEIYHRVFSFLDDLDDVEVRVTKSQIAFRRRRGFAYLWDPSRYLDTDVRVVLSLALDRQDDSARFKEVVHPSTRVWMHHLEVGSIDEIDEEAMEWLREAYEAGG